MARSTRSLWQDTTSDRRWPSLRSDLEVDVAIVGGGITGLTAAAHLVRAGQRVAVIDLHEIGGGETGHTTAHLTEVIDTRYYVLERWFGRDGAMLAAESSRVAIDEIEVRVRTLRADCGFARVPAFLYAEDEDGVKELEREHESARRAGLDVSLVDATPLPFPVLRALRVERQAQLRPLDYLAPLAEWLASEGALLFEGTRVEDVEDGKPCTVKTAEGFTVKARAVFVATNIPMNDQLVYPTKNFAYRTYAIAGHAERMPPPGLYWDTEDPYHYTRTQQTSEGELLIVGGEDHKVGAEGDTPAAYDRLEAYARERFGLRAADYRWSGQVLTPADHLPYIGPSSLRGNVYVATGFSGNGMTLGTVAGRLVADLVLERENPWAKLYRAKRFKPLASAKEFVAENVDFPAHFVVDRLRHASREGLDSLRPGDGRVLSLQGKKVAVYRDDAGQCHAVSPVCTHMGCHVRFNPAETSWDCPCHGGRFSTQGEVLNGPPVSPLQAMDELLPPEERGAGQDEAPGSATPLEDGAGIDPHH